MVRRRPMGQLHNAIKRRPAVQWVWSELLRALSLSLSPSGSNRRIMGNSDHRRALSTCPLLSLSPSTENYVAKSTLLRAPYTHIHTRTHSRFPVAGKPKHYSIVNSKLEKRLAFIEPFAICVIREIRDKLLWYISRAILAFNSIITRARNTRVMSNKLRVKLHIWRKIFLTKANVEITFTMRIKSIKGLMKIINKAFLWYVTFPGLIVYKAK